MWNFVKVMIACMLALMLFIVVMGGWNHNPCPACGSPSVTHAVYTEDEIKSKMMEQKTVPADEILTNEEVEALAEYLKGLVKDGTKNVK